MDFVFTCPGLTESKSAGGLVLSWSSLEIFKTLPDVTFPESISMSVSPPNAPPRQSRRQGQRIKRPLAVYNLCLELDDADSHSSPKEDTPTGSMDSLSSQSPTPALSGSPPGLLDRNHLMDSGDLADWTANLSGQSRSSMVSWMNTPCTNPVATNTVPSAFSFPNSSTGSDRAVESITHRKARAVYPCEAEHSSELSFQTGAIFEDGKYLLSECKAMKNKLTKLLKWLWIKIQA
uniref:Uncharacterized protein n=1 Tax=Pavo cristatus TaxID=9049 RepID=A0A8C9LGD0_PAVCR